MNLRLLPNRIIIALYLELKALRTARCGLPYAFEKWKAVLSNNRSMLFLGETFHYEDRLNPFTIFEYVNEIRDLSTLFNFKGGRVLEVGANVGIWGYALLKSFPNCALYSFEPNPFPFVCLKKNASSFKNWSIFNSGVSNQQEDVNLFYVPEKTGQGSIYKNNATINLLNSSEPSSVKVCLHSLDKTFLESKCGGAHFALVKIDVEGYEWIVLDGLKGITWDYMYVELSSERDGQVDFNDFITSLRKTWPLAKLVKATPKGLFIDVYLSCVGP